VHAALEGGGGKASHVTDDAAPQCHEGGLAVETELHCPVPDL